MKLKDDSGSTSKATEMDEATAEQGSSSAKNSPKSKALARMGIVLILFSGVFFFAMISVPWWSLTSAQKVFIGGALFVSVQVSWWVGVAMAGPTAIAKLTAMFRKSS